MLNVPELERRWKRYRLRRKLPYYILVSLLLFLGAALYYWYVKHIPIKSVTGQVHATNASSRQSVVSSTSTSDRFEHRASASKSSVQTDADVKIEQEKPVVKLKPSMGFINTFEASEDDEIDYYFAPKSQPPAKKTAPAPNDKKTATVIASKGTQTPKKTQPTTLRETLPSITKRPAAPTIRPYTDTTKTKPLPVVSLPKKQPAQKMIIQRESDMKDIQDVIARFKKNKNPALSLFVAKRYYAIGDYQQAYNYALITNEIDNTIEDSWLIFAKSLYKLGQKEMAMKTLQAYYDDSRSVKAKITLDKMKDGDFQ